MSLRLGCIADDLTGGADLALALSRGGARVAQVFGDPSGVAAPAGVDAAVASLKIRTAPRAEAMDAATGAASVLKGWGASTFFFKYCSTFDSTDDGNIGPIAEALRSFADADATPFAPSFPANGRTVYQGHLFVHDKLLSRSSMRDHPLTPMREADLQRVLGAQAKSVGVGLIPLRIVEQGSDAIKAAMAKLCGEKKPFVIIDAITEVHLDAVAAACASLPLLTGGSAIGESLAKILYGERSGDRRHATAGAPHRNGLVAILSGSCSAASQEQAARAAAQLPVFRLSPEMAADPEAHAARLAETAIGADAPAVLISSTDDPDSVAGVQRAHGRDRIGSAFERLQGQVARALYRAGVRTFIVAGGETSGAVADALGLKVMTVGDEIAPGVPWMFEQSEEGVNIAFKSGNFGGPDFYADALGTIQ